MAIPLTPILNPKHDDKKDCFEISGIKQIPKNPQNMF